MTKIISRGCLFLAVFALLAFGGCQSTEETPVKETEAQTEARNAFNENLKSLYSCPNAYIFGKFIADATEQQKEALATAAEELSDASVTGVATKTLFVEGDYTAYDAVLLVEVTTGERRVYHDRLLTVSEDGVTKVVLQVNVEPEVQRTIVSRYEQFTDVSADFESESIKSFTEKSKSFASWYEKRKDSLKINVSPYNFSSEFQLEQSPSEKDDRVLVWNEEFDNVHSIEETKVSYNGAYAMSAEDLKLTIDGSNLAFKDSCMIMTARPYPDRNIYLYSTSAAVTTYNKMHFRGGYLEMRAKVPFEFGAWPSLWMKSDGNLQTAAYMSEIDIFEVFGSNVGLASAIHKWGRDGHVSLGAGNYKFPDNEIARDWHTYGFEWTENELKFYVDRNCYSTVPIDEAHDYNMDVPGMDGYHDYHYLLLNNFLFSPKGNQNYVMQKMNLTTADTKEVVYTIDYLRLYQNPEKDRIVIY